VEAYPGGVPQFGSALQASSPEASGRAAAHEGGAASPTAPAGTPSGKSRPRATKAELAELAELAGRLEGVRRARKAARASNVQGGEAQLPSLDADTRLRLAALRSDAERREREAGASARRGANEASPARQESGTNEQSKNLLLAARQDALREAGHWSAAAAGGAEPAGGPVVLGSEEASEPLSDALSELNAVEAARDAAAAAAATAEREAARASLQAAAALAAAAEERESAEEELRHLRGEAAAFTARDAKARRAQSAAQGASTVAAQRLEQRRDEERGNAATASRRRSELELARLRLELEALRAQNAAAARAAAERHAQLAAAAAADSRRAAAAGAAADAQAAQRAMEEAHRMERAAGAKRAAEARLSRLQGELEAVRGGADPRAAETGAPSRQAQAHPAGGSPAAAAAAHAGAGATEAAPQQTVGAQPDAASSHLSSAVRRARTAVASSARFHAWMRRGSGGGAHAEGGEEDAARRLSLPSAADGADHLPAFQAPSTDADADAHAQADGRPAGDAPQAEAEREAEVRVREARGAAAAAEAAARSAEAARDEEAALDGLEGEALAARLGSRAAHDAAAESARAAALLALSELEAAQAELGAVREATRRVLAQVAAAAQAQREQEASDARAAAQRLAQAEQRGAWEAARAAQARDDVTALQRRRSLPQASAAAAVDARFRGSPLLAVNRDADAAPPGRVASGLAVALAATWAATGVSRGRRWPQRLSAALRSALAARAQRRRLARAAARAPAPVLPPFHFPSEAEALRRQQLLFSGRAKLTWRGDGGRHGVRSAPQQPTAAGRAYAAELRRIAVEWAASARTHKPTPAHSSPVPAAVARRAAGDRAVSALVTLASGAGSACCEETAARACEALAHLAGPEPLLFAAHARLVRLGAMEGASLAMRSFPQSPSVAAAACALLSRLPLTTPALLRLHLRCGVATERGLAGAISSLATHPQHVRVAEAACGAVWALALARGAAAQALALQCGAPALLLAAMRSHALSPACVRNACGALLALSARPMSRRSGLLEVDTADVDALLWAERGAIVHALRRHGGLDALLGAGLEADAPWMVQRHPWTAAPDSSCDFDASSQGEGSWPSSRPHSRATSAGATSAASLADGDGGGGYQSEGGESGRPGSVKEW